MLRSLPTALTAAAAFPASVSGPCRALLRAIDRSAEIEPLDALCLGIRARHPICRANAPDPLLAAYIGPNHHAALARTARWRGQHGDSRPPLPSPLPPDATTIRAFFRATAAGSVGSHRRAERLAAADSGLRRYRDRHACHPVLPFADWAAIQPETERLGSVIIGGCRDAGAARQLGFVPAQSVSIALDMALGVAGEGARIGFLLSPPYFPLRVG
jgi:hypothetical protein